MPDINDGERQADLDWLYGTNARPTPPTPAATPRRVAPEPPATPLNQPPAPAASAHRGVSQADFDWLYRGDTPATTAPAASSAAPASPVVPAFVPVPRPSVPAPVPFTAPAPQSYDVDDYSYTGDETGDYEDYADEEPTPPTQQKSRGSKKPESANRRFLRRTLTVILVILAIIVSVAGFYLWRVVNTVCSVTSGDSCNVGSVISVLGDAIGGNSNGTPLKTDSNGRTNVLLLGTSDDRTDVGGGDWLTDSIIVVSLSQTDKNAFMISIPRDLWIKYTGGTACSVGYQGKVNAAFYCNGAGDKATLAQLQTALKATIPTFEQITGLDIQYAADLNYAVLSSLTNAVGGGIVVDLYPTDSKGIYDVNTGLKLQPNSKNCPGSSIDPMECGLSPDLVMALARARNSDGGYGIGGGNFNREQNQQAIIVGLLKQAKTNGILTNLAGVNTALQGIGDNLRSTVAPNEIASFLTLAQEIPPTSFTSLDLVNAKPALVATGMVNDLSVVLPTAGMFNYTAIQKWIAKQISADPAVLENATIDVLNATGTAGKAATAATTLENLGFTVGNVTNYSTKVTGTQVYDLTGNKPLTSAALAKQYGVTVTTGPPPGYKASSTTDFVVIIGT